MIFKYVFGDQPQHGHGKISHVKQYLNLLVQNVHMTITKLSGLGKVNNSVVVKESQITTREHQ